MSTLSKNTFAEGTAEIESPSSTSSKLQAVLEKKEGVHLDVIRSFAPPQAAEGRALYAYSNSNDSAGMAGRQWNGAEAVTA